MEVTRTNFKELLPEIKDKIKNCTFIAIDCELTGLNTCNDINGYDTQTLYYEKMSRAMKNFLVIQYGLCLFRYNEKNNVFKQTAYNFYIFRRPVNRNVPDLRFMCQSSSIDFLSSQGFDFNKLFKEGISYLNINEEQKYRQVLQDLQKVRLNNFVQDDTSNHIPIPVEDQPFIDDIIEKIKDFVKGDENEMILPKCNAFLRRLIYQTASIKFANKVTLQTKQLENKDRVLCVSKFKSKEEMQEQLKIKIEQENLEMDEIIGFTNVLKFIVDSGKMIVGHNMCLDILHTVDKFLTPLPKEYEEFKECVSSLFTKILDTKYMSSLSPFKEHIASNVLAHLVEAVTKDPFTLPKIESENDTDYSLSCHKEHEAGYDAYITGVAFLAMWKFLVDKNKKKNKSFNDFSLLTSYMNKLYVMKVFDGLCIDLSGVDLEPKRDHVLYITFPREWKTNNIIQLFSPFGPVHVAWIDEQSAYVGLQRPDEIHVALKTLSQSDTYKIMTYAKRQTIIKQLQSSNKRSPMVRNKRYAPHEDEQVIVKKRRAVSLGEHSANDELVENKKIVEIVNKPKVDDADYGVPIERTKRKRTISKTFQEDNSWD